MSYEKHFPYWKVSPTTRLKPAFYLSDKEKQLVEFCKKNDIPLDIKKGESVRGEVEYKFNFKTKFLDELEAKIVQHLEKNGIKYSFLKTGEDMHHYQIDGFVSFEEEATKPTIINWEQIKQTAQSSGRDYKKEKEEQCAKTREICNLKSEIEKFKKEIEKLQITQDTPPTEWQRFWGRILPFYGKYISNKLYKEKIGTYSKINQLKYTIEEHEKQIEKLEEESAWLNPMLVLAGIHKDEEKSLKSKVKELEKSSQDVWEDLKEEMKKADEVLAKFDKFMNNR